MHRTKIALSLFVPLFLVLATGCSKRPEQRLTGMWAVAVEASLDATAAALEGEELEQFEAERESAIENLSAMGIEMVFKADGTTEMSMTMFERVTSTGTWEIASTEGEEIVVVITDEDDDEGEEQTFVFSGNDQFLTEMMDGTLIFNRQ